MATDDEIVRELERNPTLAALSDVVTILDQTAARLDRITDVLQARLPVQRREHLKLVEDGDDDA